MESTESVMDKFNSPGNSIPLNPHEERFHQREEKAIDQDILLRAS
jgi:hypothetical protein